MYMNNQSEGNDIDKYVLPHLVLTALRRRTVSTFLSSKPPFGLEMAVLLWEVIWEERNFTGNVHKY